MAQTAEENCRLGRRQELTPEGNEKAKKYYLQAIKLDPNYLPAYAELSYVFVREYQNAWGADRTVSLDEAEQWADKAVVLGADLNSGWHNDFRGRWYRAIVYWNRGKFDDSIAEYGAARQLITGPDPDKVATDIADLDADMAEVYIYKGDPQKAIELVEGAMTTNPTHPYWYLWNYGRALYMAGRYQDAIDAISRITPNDVRLITAASLAQLNQVDAAQLILAEFSKNDPNWSVAKSAEYPYGDDSHRQHWLDGLRKAGLKEN